MSLCPREDRDCPAAQVPHPPPWISRGTEKGGGKDSSAAHPHLIFLFLYLIVAEAIYRSAPSCPSMGRVPGTALRQELLARLPGDSA